MIRRFLFALACIVTTSFAAAAPAAAQDMHYRQVLQRCHAPMCMRYGEDGVSTHYFVIQHQTHGQNLIVCEHSYAPCRVTRRAFQQGALPTVGELLPPLTPSPTTPENEADKDDDPPVDPGETATPGIRHYQVAPGVLQPNPQ